jgi:hypothetical protein
VSRYTAERSGSFLRGKPFEWCVIDQELGLFGSAIVYDLTKQEAKDEAYRLNNQEETK